MLIVCLTATPALAQRGRGEAPTPRAAAPIDLTGYWVSLVTDDWRWRMVTPPKGDILYLPVNDAGQEEWPTRGTRRKTSRRRSVPGVSARAASCTCPVACTSPGTATRRSSSRPTRDNRHASSRLDLQAMLRRGDMAGILGRDVGTPGRPRPRPWRCRRSESVAARHVASSGDHAHASGLLSPERRALRCQRAHD